MEKQANMHGKGFLLQFFRVMKVGGQAWRYTSVISALWRQRQEVVSFRPS
jgi:hypothetical protein